MAGRWRIRHKLMLGLGLVIAILAVLLLGTLKGLSSYRATMRTINCKLVELTEANKLREQVKDLADPPKDLSIEFIELRQKVARARQALFDYREKLEETINQGRDVHKGHSESQQVQALEEQFARLEAALKEADRPRIDAGPRTPLVEQPAVKTVIEQLISTAGDLSSVIYQNLDGRMEVARHDYHVSLILVLSAGVAGLILTVALLRFFYCWILYPIRDLQQGAGRIAHGDFEHRIEVKSGDEMEDLAGAFNYMTDQLRELYGDLARQVNERSRQLVRSEKLASVGFLAAGVAHEINNPLASINFYSEALEARLRELQENATKSEKEQQAQWETVTKYLKTIQNEAFRCKNITKRLLEFSRGGDRTRQPHDLCDIIQSVLDVVQPLPLSRGKHIVYEPSIPVIAWVNDHDIKSVVLNLVVNALQSMDEGGTLTITQTLRDGQAEIAFKDTGCGMTEEVLQNIFEPFFTRNRTGQGTGLGLSISHQIITQHGGEIEVSSPGVNQGSTFVVRLPVKPADEKAVQGSDEAATPAELFAQLRRKAA